MSVCEGRLCISHIHHLFTCQPSLSPAQFFYDPVPWNLLHLNLWHWAKQRVRDACITKEKASWILSAFVVFETCIGESYAADQRLILLGTIWQPYNAYSYLATIAQCIRLPGKEIALF